MIGLVFCGDLKYCPYIRRYIERLELASKDYKVYFWNRGGFDLDLPSNYYWYGQQSDLRKGKVSKALDFFRFRSWLKNRIVKDNPDRLIVLSTLSGVIMGRFLYSGKRDYIFDIRDFSYENIKPFYEIEKRVIKNSSFTAISSPGFKTFLPKYDYIIAHNFNREDIVEGKKFNRTNGKLKFVWNGVIRYFEFQKQYLEALKNDERFEIVFHGDGPELEDYRKYCEKNGFKNVIFTGAYNNSDKARLLSDAAILNNCYGYTVNAGNKLKYAVSNRFYDGMVYHIPQLVEPSGFKPNWANKAELGISISPSAQFADELYSYYNSIDPIKFDNCCEKALKKVIKEDNEYISRIDEFITG